MNFLWLVAATVALLVCLVVLNRFDTEGVIARHGGLVPVAVLVIALAALVAIGMLT